VAGVEERTRNFWGFEAPLPEAFRRGQTGFPPVDDAIRKVKRFAYAHHIERLMVLGNYLLLTETHPNEVYDWFMAEFIDAYDWVMVPNVYGMSQFADGGMMSTKPYISGSNYIRKQSHYKKGSWCEEWDALFWRFVWVHKDIFGANPRMSMMVRTAERMSPEKLQKHLETAEVYLREIRQPQSQEVTG
jgi:deoxyribodipyrimidine photolyase-related protein